MTKDYAQLTGVEKAAIIMMSMDEDNVTKTFSQMDDEEIKEISQVMANLGSVPPEVVERLISEFTTQVSESLSFVGNLQNTEKLLSKVLGKERVAAIMEDIRGPAGRNTWDKLGNVNEDTLANYLKNEYPQTVALIMSKVTPTHAAKVMSVLPEEFTFEVIMRMLSIDAVKKEVLDNVEKTLRAEFINTLTKTQKYDSNEVMAEIFNNFDRATESKFMSLLEEKNPEAAEKIKNLMFTFEDFAKVEASGIQALLRGIDKSKLAVALKGASEQIRQLFIGNLSQRAAKILVEDMEAMGPVRMRDVDEAQMLIITAAKDLIAKGEMVISDGSDKGDELVY